MKDLYFGKTVGAKFNEDALSGDILATQLFLYLIKYGICSDSACAGEPQEECHRAVSPPCPTVAHDSYRRVCDQVRRPELWISRPARCTLEAVDDLFEREWDTSHLWGGWR